MKNLSVMKKILIAINIIFAAMSFGPCFREMRVSMLPLLPIESMEESGFKGYLPWFCVTIVIIEILLMLSKKKSMSIIGMSLNLIKTFVTYKLFEFVGRIIAPIGGLYSLQYDFTTWGKALIGVGCIITVLYLIEFIVSLRKKSTE